METVEFGQVKSNIVTPFKTFTVLAAFREITLVILSETSIKLSIYVIVRQFSF